MNIRFLFFTLTLLLTACQGNKSYTLEELASNSANKLDITVHENYDTYAFEKLCKKLALLDDTTALKDILQKENLELNEAAYTMYYLGNRYWSRADFVQGLHWHKVAAENYLNPWSYLTVAGMYFTGAKQLKAKYPTMDLAGFQQDFEKSYYYLHCALELMQQISEGNRSHYIVRLVRRRALFLLEELEAEAKKGAFDRPFIRKELKKDLQPMMNLFDQMYTDKVPSTKS